MIPVTAPSRVIPRTNKMVSTTYGKVAVKYTTWGWKEKVGLNLEIHNVSTLAPKTTNSPQVLSDWHSFTVQSYTCLLISVFILSSVEHSLVSDILTISQGHVSCLLCSLITMVSGWTLCPQLCCFCQNPGKCVTWSHIYEGNHGSSHKPHHKRLTGPGEVSG